MRKIFALLLIAFVASSCILWCVTDLRATPSTIDCPGPGGIQHISITGKLDDPIFGGGVPITIRGPHGEVHEFTRIPKIK